MILLNIHAAGQFKLLQRRLETVLERVGQAGTLGFDQKAKWAIHEEVRGCVLQHQELIWYSEQMENIFMYMTLGQLLASSIMICVAGFQIFLVSVYMFTFGKRESTADLKNVLTSNHVRKAYNAQLTVKLFNYLTMDYTS